MSLEFVCVYHPPGTGTAIGDPTEVNALGTFFANGPQKTLFLGSVKSNIGHLESAAGIAALIKVLLMLRNKCIVPSLWYTKDNENPKLNLSRNGFIVPTSCTYWNAANDKPRSACLNSFGFGGTNAHAVVTDFAGHTFKDGICRELPLVLIAADDQENLKKDVKRQLTLLQTADRNLFELSFSFDHKKKQLPRRKAFFAESKESLIQLCEAFIKNNPTIRSFPDKKQIVFVFCGVGTVWQGMCTWLMRNVTFSSTLDAIDNHLQPLTGWKIKDKLEQEDKILLENTMVAHIAIFACQIGIFEVWKHLGITPDIVIGQSVGEVAAAFASGAIDMETAVKIIFFRSKFLAEINSGGMAVVLHSDVDVIKSFCQREDQLYIAVYNSPVSCTVSGASDSINGLQDKFTSNGTKITVLDVRCAYHSPHVNKAAQQLNKSLGLLPARNQNISMISTVTGKHTSVDELTNSYYWERNVRCPVLLSDAVKLSKTKSSHTVFVEIGPSAVLQAHIKDIFLGEIDSVSIIPSVCRHEEQRTFLQACCDLYELGMNIDWHSICPKELSTKLPMPRHIFKKNKTLCQTENSTRILQCVNSKFDGHPYVRLVKFDVRYFEFTAELDNRSAPLAYTASVDGVYFLQNGTFADIGFYIGTMVYGCSEQNLKLSIDLLRRVSVDPALKTTLHVQTYEEKNEISFHIFHKDVVACRGWLVKDDFKEKNFYERLTDIKVGMQISPHVKTSQKGFYDFFKSLRINATNTPYLIQGVFSNYGEAFLDIVIQGSVEEYHSKLSVLPSIIDCMLQSTVLCIGEQRSSDTDKSALLPKSSSGIRIYKIPEKKMHIYTKILHKTDLESVEKYHFSSVLMDSLGRKIAEIQNSTSYRKRANCSLPFELRYNQFWIPQNEFLQEAVSPVITLIHRGFSNDEIEDFLSKTSFTLLSCSADEAKAKDIFAGKGNKKSLLDVDAIVFIVRGKMDNKNISETYAIDIYESATSSCMFVIDMIRYFSEIDSKTPLYIATEGTQLDTNKTDLQANFIGSELWGLVRSAHTDFLFEKLTCIDLQPSLQSTKQILLEFVASTCKNVDEIGTDFVIYDKTVYALQLRNSPTFNETPETRSSICRHPVTSKSQMTICYSNENEQRHFCSVPMEAQAQSQKTHQTVIVKITTITLPPLCLQRSSVFHNRLKPCGLNTRNYIPLYALEYCGELLAEDACSKSKPHGKNEIKEMSTCIVLYPDILQAEMEVPKQFVVISRDLPCYEPGLLTQCVFLWKFLEYIPKKGKVPVFCKNTTSKRFAIFKAMASSMKKAVVCDVSVVENQKDLCIALDDISEHLSLISMFSKVVCLQSELLNESIQALTFTGKVTVEVLNPHEIFSEKYLRKNVKKMVNWIKTNHSTIAALSSNAISDEHDIPFKYISICSEDGLTSLPSQLPSFHLFSKNATYVITGGLTGLGWELTKLIAEMGAGTITTIQRSAINAETTQKIIELERNTKCKIISLNGDVTKLKQLRKLFRELCDTTDSPIRGIFHGAAALDNTPLISITMEQIEKVLKPKILGTLNLHIISCEMDLHLEYFIGHSSINSVIGSPGQSNYGAANTFLDSFMYWRRAQSFPGQSINWGGLGVGLGLQNNYDANFHKRGALLMTVTEIRSCFLAAVLENSTGIVYTKMNWESLAQVYSVQNLKRVKMMFATLFKEQLSSDRLENVTSFDLDMKQLNSRDLLKQKADLTNALRYMACKSLNVGIKEIPTNKSAIEMGFDSLGAISFINLVQAKFKYRIPVEFVWSPTTTIEKIVDHLQQNVFDIDVLQESVGSDFASLNTKECKYSTKL